MKKIALLFSLSICLVFTIQAQNVGMGLFNTTPFLRLQAKPFNLLP